jgi:hypothetical protein
LRWTRLIIDQRYQCDFPRIGIGRHKYHWSMLVFDGY